MKKELKRTYFISDMHLGAGGFENSLEREKLLVSWLDIIKHDAQAIYMVGDIFDFWHEWNRCAPQGFTRFLGRLAELSDNGIELHFFTGNHDIWTYNYLTKEIGFKLYRNEQEMSIMGKKFYIAHGDGLGPGDKVYKILKKIFTNKFLQWCFKNLLHPDWALKFAHTWADSRKLGSRAPHFHQENEWLVIHSKEVLQNQHFDYFVYGHRHIPVIYELNESSKFIILGDWIKNFTYGVFDGKDFKLEVFKSLGSTSKKTSQAEKLARFGH